MVVKLKCQQIHSTQYYKNAKILKKIMFDFPSFKIYEFITQNREAKPMARVPVARDKKKYRHNEE